MCLVIKDVGLSEYEHAILVYSLLDLVDRGFWYRLREVYALNFGNEGRVQWLEFEGSKRGHHVMIQRTNGQVQSIMDLAD